ncbi:hypothetical protein C8J56DRAFT_1068407 [Mycena floridula]|nr:hypothetical protein C8J56DRAFT_1068407 [Mycena floridula]
MEGRYCRPSPPPPDLSTQLDRAVLMQETLAKISDHVNISSVQFDITGTTAKDDWFHIVDSSTLPHIVDIGIQFNMGPASPDFPNYLQLIPQWVGGLAKVEMFRGLWMDLTGPEEKELVKQLVEHCPTIRMVEFHLAAAQPVEIWLRDEGRL